MDKKVIVITGCSSGLGFELAIKLAKLGHSVYAGSRKANKLEKKLEKRKYIRDNLKVIKLDVAKERTVKNSFNKILSQEGRVDILINNAGYGLVGAIENLRVSQIKDVLNINLIGYIRCIKSVLPTMRKNGSGIIINISSVSGVVASSFLGAYCASKFGLEGLIESLKIELYKYNIRVVLVEPGLLNSSFIKNSKIENNPINNPYFCDVNKYINSIKSLDKTKKVQDAGDLASFIINQVIFTKKKGLRFQTNNWSKKIVYSKLKRTI